MTPKPTQIDLARLTDDKALAIASYGQSVAAYRYIILAEKAPARELRDAFEAMALEERRQRVRLQALLQRLCPSGGFYLASQDKLAVCVGPRLVDARDDARFDEAMRLVITSEKRAASFFSRYAQLAKDPEVRGLFTSMGNAGLAHVQRLRALFRESGRHIAEPCPVPQLKQ